MPEERFEERTEPATPRKRQEARERGHVARSADLSTGLILLAAVLAMNFFGERIFGGVANLCHGIYENIGSYDPSPDTLGAYLVTGGLHLAGVMLPLFVVVVAFALAAHLLQIGFIMTGHPLIPDLNRLNPITGLGRILSIRGLVRLCFSLMKVAALAVVLYLTIRGEWLTLVHLVDMQLGLVVANFFDLAYLLAFRAALVLLIIGLLDFGYQKWQHERDLRMSRQELKEEMKRYEGDPRVRQRRRQAQRQMAVQRMMAAVPRATVVITNPTELAIALHYERDQARNFPAPRVVAKGAGYLAEKIRATAEEHDVPVLERKQLVQALYPKVQVGDLIPQDFYAAVAEVLAYVYRKQGKAVEPLGQAA